MKHIFVFFIFIILICSCKEDIYYETSISIMNELDDSLSVILYPKVKPFHSMQELDIAPNFKQILYGRKKTDLNIMTLMTEVFDSVVIFRNSIIIKLSPDTITNCNFNPYKDLTIWESEIVESNMRTNFTNTRVISEDYYFTINELDIISK